MTAPTGPHDPLHEVALALMQDQVTAEVGTALAAAGVPTVLLKGPTFARWLYRPGEHRPYLDTDLLVPRHRYRRACRVLRRMGFRPIRLLLTWRHDHATTWSRPADGAAVDLHHMFGRMDAAVDPWPALAGHLEPIEVAGAVLTGLDEPARCLHVALHAVTAGESTKPLADLRRAIAVGPEPAWREAVELARRLGCEPELAYGMRRTPDGAALAARVGVTGAVSERAVAGELAVGPGRAWGRLSTQRTLAGKASFLVASAFTGRVDLRHKYPWARGPLVAAAFVVDDARKVGRLLRGRRRWQAVRRERG